MSVGNVRFCVSHNSFDTNIRAAVSVDITANAFNGVLLILSSYGLNLLYNHSPCYHSLSHVHTHKETHPRKSFSFHIRKLFHKM